MSASAAIHAAAEAIRALPDHELVRLALQAEAADELARANLRLEDARPTAALREEIAQRDLKPENVVVENKAPAPAEAATSTPRPSVLPTEMGRPPVVQQRIRDLLSRSPKTTKEIVEATGHDLQSVKNGLSRLRLKGIVSPPVSAGGAWTLAERSAA